MHDDKLGAAMSRLDAADRRRWGWGWAGLALFGLWFGFLCAVVGVAIHFIIKFW